MGILFSENKKEFSKKRILIIGAGWEQVPLIKKAKEMGLYVVATHPDETGDGLSFADEKEIVNPRDLPKILDIAKKHKIDAATADECDYSYFASVFVANNLGLPGTKIDTAQLSTNKKRVRIKCQEYGILQPTFYPCVALKEVKEAVGKIGFPIIMKPLDNRGNFGVNQVLESSEIEPAFYEAIANSHSREILVEKFIEGTMIMIDGYVFDNLGHIPLAISSKKMLGGRKRVAMDIIYPAQIPEQFLKKALETTNQIANKALKLERGATHTEFILDKKGDIYLIEIHNRGGGVFISNKIVPAVSGVDVSECLIRHALGEKVTLGKEPDILTKFALLKFFRFSPGKVKKILDIEKSKKTLGLLEMRLSIKEGDIIKEITNDANRHGFTITVGDSADEVYKISNQAISRIKIIYD